MPRWLPVTLGAALFPLLAIKSPAAAQGELANPPITLRIGYLKGTTDLTLAKAHGSLERENWNPAASMSPGADRFWRPPRRWRRSTVARRI